MTKVRVNFGPTADGIPVKLFVVFNTNHNSLYVLARDRGRAMSIARTAAHVYDTMPKTAETYGRHVDEVTRPHRGKLEDHWALVEAAIARRLEGTIHFEEEQMLVGDEPIEA